MGRGDTLLNAGIGAVVTVVLSFTGFSPLVGGGVAGYLQREGRTAGATAGALSGALAFVPFVLLAVLVFGLLGVGLLGWYTGVPGGAGLLVVLLIGLPLALLWNVGLGAAGGYAGSYLDEESDTAG